jgi:signal transduction histidine kinase
VSLRSLAPPRWDLLLAAVILAAGELEIGLAHVGGPRWASIGAAALGAAVLAWRRLLPVAVVVLAFSVESAQFWAGVPRSGPITPLIVFMVATYTLGSRAALRDALLGGAFAVAMMGAVVASTSPFDATDFPYTALIAVAPLILGRALRSTREEARASVARAERAHALATEEALAAERARIARELHDVVSHSISVMGVQAGAARRLLPEGQGELYELLASIEATGRDSVGEMRRLLGIVRAGEEPLARAPQPGLGALDELVEHSRAGGLVVEVDVSGAPRALPAGLELAAFRIVQEALTNVRKHAPGARVDVAVRWRDHELALSVADDGPGPINPSPGGHGIVGMRERALLYGGQFEVGPGADGGFRVHARLPLPSGTR